MYFLIIPTTNRIRNSHLNYFDQKIEIITFDFVRFYWKYKITSKITSNTEIINQYNYYNMLSMRNRVSHNSDRFGFTFFTNAFIHRPNKQLNRLSLSFFSSLFISTLSNLSGRLLILSLSIYKHFSQQFTFCSFVLIFFF